ncbi:MAG: pyruvate dehydrogenase (acetyl-transferring) E1 component subunit alpha [Planctomycetota bacterium]
MSQAATQNPAAASSDRPSASLPDDRLLKWLYDMQLIREFETRTMQAYQSAKIGGFCHIYSGQEACAVGTIGSVEHNDPVVTAYRDHGHALARGMDPKACMAEMFGKLAGCAKGKGGSMHMFDKPNHLYGGHGIVGAQTPLGAGFAFGARYAWEVLEEGPKKVCLCYLGDGALNQGAFHEAQNLAGLYGLPVIYIVENNGYSMGTSIERGTTMADQLTLKAEGYGIKGIQIDGLDVLNVYDHFKPLVDECRDLQRPGFVDLKTYRYQGHSMSDPQKYRTKDEVEEFKGQDSIAALLSHLLNDRNAIDEDGWKAMQAEIRGIVKEAVDFAERTPEPSIEAELYSDVYIKPMDNLSPTRNFIHGSKNELL